ncbi:hypothetical protein [Streptococcus iniae]|uniref:Uncharacterized protein n=1 Tax=Streptococcus iniae TaxID=1346 RepID=A0A3L8GE13_STRIN|nr:hypothetical protein [Streptococcus iniae]AGM99602.1 hypothetical protein K710_1852 [Streptococcus iniae SF1]AHY16518.1 hypothetical protein DQ08_08715 [Streptococcus iniae]AHY18382.1 hypothetical protein DW64_08700 [Streptococcus iniae]AJG26667.1 hypothetical protein SI82_08800 [Streptococcus iniae]APD32541.1 hypothetical protein BMF34_08710 [Streptococcus iniae]
MTERTLSDIESDERLLKEKLESSQAYKRKLQTLKDDIMELQLDFLHSLKLGDAYLTEPYEFEENNDFIQRVNNDAVLLEESYDKRLEKVSQEIVEHENALDNLYYERQVLNQKEKQEKGGKNGQS